MRSLAELVNLTQDDLQVGIFDNLKKLDNFTAILLANAGVTDRPTIKWNRLASVPAAVVADCSTTLTSEAISASPFTADLFTIVRQFDACTIGAGLYSTYTDVVESEVQGALKSINEKIANDALQGNGSTSFNGIENYTTNSFAIAGSTLDLSDMDKLLDEVKGGPNKVFVGAPAAIRALRREIREAGAGSTAAEIAGRMIPTYENVPYVASEFVDAGKIHLVDLDEGFKIVFGTTYDPALNGGAFALEDLGSSKTKLAKEWRLYAHVAGWSATSQGLAVLTGAV
jgi:hypothetical protein